MRRADGRWSTRFGAWVSSVTVAGVLRGLHTRGHPLTKQAVYQWVSGATLPRLPIATALVDLSRGRITVADMLEHRARVRDSSHTLVLVRVPQGAITLDSIAERAERTEMRERQPSATFGDRLGVMAAPGHTKWLPAGQRAPSLPHRAHMVRDLFRDEGRAD